MDNINRNLKVYIINYIIKYVGHTNFRKAFSKIFVKLLTSGVGPSSRVVVGSRCKYLSVFGNWLVFG